MAHLSSITFSASLVPGIQWSQTPIFSFPAEWEVLTYGAAKVARLAAVPCRIFRLL